jgi:hypothetical protein
VRFVVSFGGYYDLRNVLSFIATGYSDFQGKRYFRKPREYGKWVFLEYNLDWVSDIDPAQKPLSPKNLFSFYLPEGWKLFMLTYRLLGYR